jgi:hypothetical protein
MIPESLQILPEQQQDPQQQLEIQRGEPPGTPAQPALHQILCYLIDHTG